MLLLVAAARIGVPMAVSGEPFRLADLIVYRQGGLDVLSGRDIYQPVRDGDLPFTYPPFAALVFAPLALLGPVAAQWAFDALAVAALVASVVVVGRRLGMDRPLIVGWSLLGLCLAPIVRSLLLGQIGTLLMAAVLIDVFVLPARYRGLITGVVAGIKLTPAVFVAVPFVRRDWGWVARIVGAGIGTVAVAALWRPEASVTYWTKLVWDPQRIGDLRYPDNVSITGVLARLMSVERPPTLVTAPLQLLVIAVTVYAISRRFAARDTLGAVLAAAVGGLLISPVTWSHHWCWVVPLLMWLTTPRPDGSAVPAGRDGWLAVALLAGHLVEPLTVASVAGESSFATALYAAALPVLGVVLLLRLARPSGVDHARDHRAHASTETVADN